MMYPYACHARSRNPLALTIDFCTQTKGSYWQQPLQAPQRVVVTTTGTAVVVPLLLEAQQPVVGVAPLLLQQLPQQTIATALQQPQPLLHQTQEVQVLHICFCFVFTTL